MPYTPFDDTVPDATAESIEQMGISARENFAAMRDALMAGYMPGWAMTVTAGTGSAEEPQYIVWSKGTERLRTTQTWGTTGGEAGNVTALVIEYSSNSGSTYDNIDSLTISYDASGNVTGVA